SLLGKRPSRAGLASSSTRPSGRRGPSRQFSLGSECSCYPGKTPVLRGLVVCWTVVTAGCRFNFEPREASDGACANSDGVSSGLNDGQVGDGQVGDGQVGDGQAGDASAAGCAIPAMDDFADGVPGPLWQAETTGANVTVAETLGRLEISFSTTPG